MAQLLRELSALPGALSWVPSTHIRKLTATCNSSPEDLMPSSGRNGYLQALVHVKLIDLKVLLHNYN